MNFAARRRQMEGEIGKDLARRGIIGKKEPVNESVKTAVILADKPAPVTAAQAKPVVKPVSTLFSQRDSTNYYFVVNVSTGAVDLAPSRFGIGQFNRAHFDNSNISHQLTYISDTTEFIYIGKFNSLADVKAYARAIIPLMGDIMKIPKEKYSFFIITKQNLDKLADQKTLDGYLDYYQKNY